MKKNKTQKKRGASREQRKTLHLMTINLRWCLAVSALLVFAFGAIQAVQWLRASMDVPIERIAIVGEYQHVSRKQLENLLKPFVSESYLMVDLSEIKNRIEAEPWVKTVLVKRRWPNRLDVIVEEQRPFAQWGDKSFLNAQGEVFTPRKTTKDETLPFLRGNQGAEKAVLAEFHRINSRLLEKTGLSLKSLEIDPKGAKSVVLSNGVELLLGATENDIRIERFMTIYQTQLVGKIDEIDRIDMRYTNGLAVRWRPAMTALAGQ